MPPPIWKWSLLNPATLPVLEILIQKKKCFFTSADQGSNYTKAMQAIASVPFDLAFSAPQFQNILWYVAKPVPLCTALEMGALQNL